MLIINYWYNIKIFTDRFRLSVYLNEAMKLIPLLFKDFEIDNIHSIYHELCMLYVKKTDKTKCWL